MNQLLILGSALLPAILLLLFIYHKDSKPEPKKLLLKAFFIGVLITIPIILLELGISYILFGSTDVVTGSFVTALISAILAHGIYDTIAFSSGLSAEWGGALTLLLIVFCVRMHKFCKSKLDEHLLRDKDFANFGLQNHEEEL